MCLISLRLFELAGGQRHCQGYDLYGAAIGYIGPEVFLEVADFRRIALSFEGAEEGSHMGAADFRVGGRIFATLASQAQGYGNLMLTPVDQAAFVSEQPEFFLPVAGGWGRMGATHVRLATVTEDVLQGALHCAWKRRREKNGKRPIKAGR